MPRLLLFGPCSRVIVDRDDESVSLVALMSTIQRATPDQPLETGSFTDLDWGNVAVWLRLPGDEGKVFEQRFQIVLPDSTVFGNAIVRFIFRDRIQQNTIRGKIFPIGQLGEYQLRISIREVMDGMSDDEGWEVAMDYPIIVAELNSEAQKIESSRRLESTRPNASTK
jgi:hypothetical protein